MHFMHMRRACGLPQTSQPSSSAVGGVGAEAAEEGAGAGADRAVADGEADVEDVASAAEVEGDVLVVNDV